MILTNNLNYLRIHNRTLIGKLTEKVKVADEKNVFVELSKKGLPTLKININGKLQYVHSKYDPETEAERLMMQLEDMDQYEHVLFIGVGLGYHIKEFLIKFPDIKFSIYEPNLEVLYEFLSHQDLTKLPVKHLVKIISTIDEQQLCSEISTLTQSTFIFTLPIYENLYSNQVKIVVDSIVKGLRDKRIGIGTNFTFQKLWTINSIKNFDKILKTPNILHDIDKEAFKSKPAIIVAAGPSLNMEFENLKYIKEKGLAYIFSVGSAINALIEHGIYPDAACTYDPSEGQDVVTQKIKDKQIKNIPLVYGSSVGFKAIENYPGYMLHMITSQDTIAPELINASEDINIVHDAHSIAVVTLELLEKLGCSQIILVGQNLAFLENSRYADGISYDFVNNELSEQEQKSLIIVEDVYGNDVRTDEVFNLMRNQLEVYINLFRNVEVINTTKGGAQIAGAEFIPLSEVILKKWAKKTNSVTLNWFMAKNSYDISYTIEQIVKMESKKLDLEQTMNSSLKIIRKINSLVKINKTNELDKNFIKLDKEFNKINQNLFYKAFIEPMLRVHKQRLIEETQKIRFEKDLIKKGHTVAHMFAGFLIDTQQHINTVFPLLEELKVQIQTITNQTGN